MSAQATQPSLYERLGGIYNIATVVDDFIDRVMTDFCSVAMFHCHVHRAQIINTLYSFGNRAPFSAGEWQIRESSDRLNGSLLP
jgi:hypothetical protein